VGGRTEYNQKLGSKQAHHAMYYSPVSIFFNSIISRNYEKSPQILKHFLRVRIVDFPNGPEIDSDRDIVKISHILCLQKEVKTFIVCYLISDARNLKYLNRQHILNI